MMARAPVDLAATTRDIKNRCARAAGNLELITQTKEPIFPDPRQVMLELVLAQHEIEAAVAIMVVNIAARLEGIAEPGGICLSGSAFDHVRGKIEADFVDLGIQSLKNIAWPVRVYAVKAGLGAPASAPAFASAGPPRLSIVVLPFANLGGDP
jgi:hypothetical protein